MTIAELAALLEETSIRHGAFEAVTPPHNWWDWYAAYMDARQNGFRARRGLRLRRGATWRRCCTLFPDEVHNLEVLEGYALRSFQHHR